LAHKSYTTSNVRSRRHLISRRINAKYTFPQSPHFLSPRFLATSRMVGGTARASVKARLGKRKEKKNQNKSQREDEKKIRKKSFKTASCHVGHTGTHLMTKVMQRWAWIVLRGVTTQITNTPGVPSSWGLGRRRRKHR
jgi:hypothetical protein